MPKKILTVGFQLATESAETADFRDRTSLLGSVDKKDSQGGLIVIQADICDGDQLGTRPDVG
ncbi:hypothetical protein, partial [Pseudooceanicola sp.]|uniref:hypothetical protein n=1 Tax=Pseudooceanicola sp. TaxID=1914328 RepID=UPI0035C6CA6D